MIARRWFLGGLAMAISPCGGRLVKAADLLPAPSGKVILTISGSIKNHNHGDIAQLDREMIEALGMVSLQTATPWYSGVMKFEGVPMAKLLEYVGAFGKDVTAYALNDYSTTIPASDFDEFRVILALKRNGNYMPVNDKGPLFIVYPFDSDPQLQQQKNYSRAARQVARLVVS